jgi:hypothetical protein
LADKWPFFVKLTKKINWFDPNVLYSFDEYQKKGIDPNISGKKSLAQSNIRISSYRRFKMSAYGKQAENFSFINFRPLWPCLHLKKV